MTIVYWVAAAAALLSAIEAAGELIRDRLPALAAWALSMTALSASLALAAADPTLLHSGPGPDGSLCAGLGILGTWAFAQVLSLGQGDARPVARIMTTPILGGAWATLILLGLHWAGSHGTANAELASIGTQLTIVAYYAPALLQIAFLARQRAVLTSPSWARIPMRAVCASAVAELALTMAKSAVVVAGASGLKTDESATTVIAFLQGIAVIWGIGALAVGPAVLLVSARCWPFLAYWRLRALRTLLRDTVPDMERPAPWGSWFSIRARLLQRVTEIRDAECALSPYWREGVAASAQAATRSAGLGTDLEQAVIEAALIVDAVNALSHGEPAPPVPLPPEQVNQGVGDDLQSEAHRLIEVARAVRRCPLIRELRSAESSPR